MNIYLGVDTGGTFTDFVLFKNNQLQTHKVLSTPHAPEQAILAGIKDLQLNTLANTDNLYIVHGSTVATNAVLEGKGVSTVFITNRGFKDMLSLGRQARRELYNLQPEYNAAPVKAECCLETGGRLSASGEVLDDLTAQDLENLVAQVRAIKPQAVVVNLLFSYLDNHFEQQIAQALEKALPELFISCSSNILPEYKEYERGMTTWLNAYVGPLVQGYLQRLQQGVSNIVSAKNTITVMQSAGNTIAAELAGEQAVHMLLSGPAGGLAAAEYLGKLTNFKRLLTFDMGGTSTDVALIEGKIQLTNESKIADYPVAIPMVDMHTIGAGGGSIAFIDGGGLLQVGPKSAGANPGPACYGQGGVQPTVTDANLVLGRLLPAAFLGGGMSLDVAAASKAINMLAEQLNLSCEQTAHGIINIANEHMANALRVMSVQRGIDPRDLCLTSFGGAGGLHVCALANALQISTAMVPMHSGVLSALGMLVAPKGRELSHTFNAVLSESLQNKITQALKSLIAQGEAALFKEAVASEDIMISTRLDCRYQGQSYTLDIPYVYLDSSAVKQCKQDFIARHQQRYGHSLNLPIELVNIRVSLNASQTTFELSEVPVKNKASEPIYRVGNDKEVAVYQRIDLAVSQIINGPALIIETTATTFVDSGWRCEMDVFGNLVLVNIL
ncbi:N-methylhydantoinase A [hydrothermal vent metagenome]|uniref:N-methylhydantoinase A n=1 Tax=hydrothermal vent metagenome TaxID=652676 RepID=A0A3B0ZS01_9ZZZZ